jgi:hypothetical protein
MKSATVEAELDFYPISQVLVYLRISESTLRRTAKLLREKMGDEFEKRPYEQGYSPQDFQILQEYFRLRRLGMSTNRAADHLRVYGV